MKKHLKNKPFKVTLAVIVSFLLVVGILFGIYSLFFNPYRFADYDAYFDGTPATLDFDAVLSKKQAVGDMEYMLNHFKSRHPATVKGVPEAIQRQFDLEIANFGEEVTVLELFRASSRVFALMSDGHTRVETRGIALNHIDGISFGWQEDDFLVFKEGDKAGKKVTAINGVPIEEIYDSFMSSFSYETKNYGQCVFANILVSERYLALVGVDVSNGIDIFVEGEEKPIHAEMTAIESNTAEEEKPFVYYEIDKEKSLGVLTVESCNPNEEYVKTVNEFFTAVRNQGVKTIALDLRSNGGGDSGVADEFMRYMPITEYDTGWWYHRYGDLLIKEGSERMKNNQYSANLVFDGKVYVMTNVYTYSSATTFASLLKCNGLAEIVGEQSGNTQEFGEILPFSAPNSHLLFCVSNKNYFLGGKSGDTFYTVPDYPCKSSEALDEVYSLIEKQYC